MLQIVLNIIFISKINFAQDIGLEAFKSTLYPALRMNCVKCHDGSTDAPGHSVADPTAAYIESKYHVDFSDIDKSVFVKRVRSKHWLKYDENEKGMTEVEIKQLLQKWWDDGEYTKTQTFAYVSHEIEIPANLPAMKDQKYADITFDLGKTDARLKNCGAKVQIQRGFVDLNGNSNSYRVKDLNVICPNSSFYARGIFFLVTDHIASYENIYEDLELNVSMNSPLHIVNEPMILIKRKNVDLIKIVFKEIKF